MAGKWQLRGVCTLSFYGELFQGGWFAEGWGQSRWTERDQEMRKRKVSGCLSRPLETTPLYLQGLSKLFSCVFVIKLLYLS